MDLISSPPRLRERTHGFSLVEVVVAIGVFAVAVLAILGLLLPNTKAVADQIDAGVAQRLTENIQLELQRYSARTFELQRSGNGLNSPLNRGFNDFENNFYSPAAATAPDKSIFMVATRDGSRVLVTGEDPYAAWNDTYRANYNPANPDATYYLAVVPPLAPNPVLPAEQYLSTQTMPAATPLGTPPGIAFRDRFFLIEVSLTAHPVGGATIPEYRQTKLVGASQHAAGFMPCTVTVRWPYRLPDGPANPPATPSTTSDYNNLVSFPWTVVNPSKHSTLVFNIVLTP